MDYGMEQGVDIFENVNLQGSNLIGVEFTNCIFKNSDLSGVNFSEAIFAQVEFLNCKFYHFLGKT